MRPVLFLVLFAASAASAQTSLLHANPGSTVTIRGTSNVRDWACTTASFDMTAAAVANTAAELGRELTALEVSVPVDSLDCGDPKMNSNLRKAMHSDARPKVRFRMTRYSATPAGGAYCAVLQGMLTINGVTKPVEIKGTVTPDGQGAVRVEAGTELKTPDYKVPAVKAAGGTIRTGETVTIALSIIATR